MRPDLEIARIKRDYREQWPQLEKHASIQKALTDKDPIRLGELAAMLVYGNYYDQRVGHQASHSVTAFINYEAVEFDSVESANKYIAHQESLNPSLKVGPVFKRTKDGMELISN